MQKAMEEEEMLTDFKSLRARFQNACRAMEPANRLQGNALQKHIAFRHIEPDTSTSKKMNMLVSTENNLHQPDRGDLKPGHPPERFSLPRVSGSTLDLREEMAAQKKQNLEASSAGSILAEVGHHVQQKQKSVAKNPADAVSHSTFRHKLQIWEMASSHDDKKQAEQPSRHTTTKPLNPTHPGSMDLCTPAKSSQRTPPVSRTARIIIKELPSSSAIPCQEQPLSDYPSFPKDGNCAKGKSATNSLHKEMVISDSSNETKSKRESVLGQGQHPQMRSLPSTEVFGPPPKKPARPPMVDLSPFLHATVRHGSREILGAGAVESDYMSPQNDELENYEDQLELQNSFNSINLCPIAKAMASTSEMVIPENKVLQSSYLFGMNSDEPENYEDVLQLQKSLGYVDLCPVRVMEASTHEPGIPENEDSQPSFLVGVNRTENTDQVMNWKKRKTQREETCHLEQQKLSKEKEKKDNELKKKLKITGSEQVLYKAQINEDCKAEKNMLTLKQGDIIDIIRISDCPSGKWIAKDKGGNFGYVYVKALKVDKETIAESQWSLKQREVADDVYDDVEGMENGLPAMNLSPFSSDSFSEDTIEETYDDVQAEDTFTLKSEEDGKSKGLGKFFKLKSYKSKENLDYFSSSIPKLDMYDDIDPNPKTSKDKDDKLKIWMIKFPTPKEKERRKSTEMYESEERWYADVHTPTSRNIFRNRLDKEKNKKMTKEEKLFRERFEYTKEILVINTAMVGHSSGTSKKGKLDLRITQGEMLDIIDITNSNQVICRNSEGKYGYVSVEHLTFLEG